MHGHAAAIVLNWGAIPDWVLAIGNLAVLATAFETIRRDRKRTQALEAENLRRRQDSELERASLVSAWPEEWSDQDVSVTCRNGCAEPIYDVVVRVGGQKDDPPPRSTDRGDTKSAFLMRPGESLEVIFPLLRPAADQPRVDMAFRDTRGHRWWRKSDGTIMLIQYSGSQPELQRGKLWLKSLATQILLGRLTTQAR